MELCALVCKDHDILRRWFFRMRAKGLHRRKRKRGWNFLQSSMRQSRCAQYGIEARPLLFILAPLRTVNLFVSQAGYIVLNSSSREPCAISVSEGVVRVCRISRLSWRNKEKTAYVSWKKTRCKHSFHSLGRGFTRCLNTMTMIRTD
jgi:hypothetical protein